MISLDELLKHGYPVYSLVVAAAKRARAINEWRLQRARVLFDEEIELSEPKPTTQALQEIADGVVRVVVPTEEPQAQEQAV